MTRHRPKGSHAHHPAGAIAAAAVGMLTSAALAYALDRSAPRGRLREAPARGDAVTDAPGVPLRSGFRRLSDEEQEAERARTRRIQAKVAPVIEEWDRLQRRAAVEARSTWLR